MICVSCMKCGTPLEAISIGYVCRNCHSFYDMNYKEMNTIYNSKFVPETDKISVVRCRDCKHYLILPNCFFKDGS